MEPNPGTMSGSIHIRPEPEETGLEALQFREEIQRIVNLTLENASSFTALLELPATQAVELLHLSQSDGAQAPPSGDIFQGIGDDHKPYLPSFDGNLTFPSNRALIERAAKFSVFAAGENSPETSSVPSNSSANLGKVKSEPAETDSNPNSSQPLVPDPTVENKTQRSAKRKEREKKVKLVGFRKLHCVFPSWVITVTSGSKFEPTFWLFWEKSGQRVYEEEQERELSRS